MTDTGIQFDCTVPEMRIVKKIVDRAVKLKLFKPSQRTIAVMNLEACHSNGCKLDFDRLLAADDINFKHDIAGIERHIDKETGKLDGMFQPRHAQHVA